MVILDEVKRRLSELAPEVTDMHDALAIERSRVRLAELEQKSACLLYTSLAVHSDCPPLEEVVCKLPSTMWGKSLWMFS